MEKEKVFAMSVAKVYPLLVAKAERKGRTKAGVSYEVFFSEAPQMNPNFEKIKGSICGVKIQDIEDPLMKKIRWLDKLVDELAKGKPMDKILR